MSKKQMNNEAGFMGLEGMGALLFYLVMIAGAALLIAQLFSGGKLTEMEKGLSSMRMGIQQLYTAQGNYGADNAATMTATVAKAGILPDGFAGATDGTIASPWDTAITVAATKANDTAADGSAFTITVADVPAEDCVKLATYDLNAWIAIKVGDKVIKDADTPGTVATAQTACAGAPATLTFIAK